MPYIWPAHLALSSHSTPSLPFRMRDSTCVYVYVWWSKCQLLTWGPSVTQVRVSVMLAAEGTGVHWYCVGPYVSVWSLDWSSLSQIRVLGARYWSRHKSGLDTGEIRGSVSWLVEGPGGHLHVHVSVWSHLRPEDPRLLGRRWMSKRSYWRDP